MVPDLEAFINRLPGIRKEFLQAQRYSDLISINRKDCHFQWLSTSDHVTGMPYSAPGKLGNMHQTLDTAQVDENSKGRDIGYLASDSLADVKAFQKLNSLPRTSLCGPLRKNEPTPLWVELDHLQTDGASDQRFHHLVPLGIIAGRFHVHQV